MTFHKQEYYVYKHMVYLHLQGEEEMLKELS